ncbi:MAG: putative DNA binding domain-containing protein [candidate division KSB1 bacterium]|nr:putative DNA binding domain-containing protein [candidate division KSB1 bacterium]MDZ7401551.1 putative DNA binding domain-containing protein [candidate division KSB1 bacterium]
MSIKEAQDTEFKSDWRDEHLKVVSAFANSKGGTLIIGLNDKGQPVVVEHVNRLLEDIPNKIRNRLGIIPFVELEKVNEHEIIKIKIHPSSVPISHNGKFYLRTGSTVQELQGKDLADFLIRKTGIAWDNSIEDKGDLNCLNHTTIEDFKRFAVDRIPSIVRETDFIIILQKLNLIENQSLKRAAILLFGNEPQRFYSHAYIKIGRFLSDTDIQTTDVVKGNLFQQLENSLEILRTKYLKSNISYEGIHRRDILEYPYEALREAIINALIHRDYWGTSHIQIRVYSDKLVIMNEGSLPPEVPVEKLKTNHLSKPRNKLLAEVFYYAGFIEAWGRGTLMMVDKCIEQGLPEPEFIEDHGVMNVIFYKDKWTEEHLRKLGCNERQIKAVMFIKEKGMITNKNYTELNNISRQSATRDLAELVSKKIIKLIGEGKRGSHYILYESKMRQ